MLSSISRGENAPRLANDELEVISVMFFAATVTSLTVVGVVRVLLRGACS